MLKDSYHYSVRYTRFIFQYIKDLQHELSDIHGKCRHNPYV
jgi:hypothetical protein